MNKSYANLEELLIELDLNPRSKPDVLKNAGNEIDCGYFIVTEDGHCHLFAKDGKLNDISRIKYINAEHVRNDIKKIIIPDSVTNIGSSAFSGCNALASVTIPDGVTSIGSSAFSGCSGLVSITIPDTVMNIGEGVFEYCRSLTNMMIPNSVTNIGKWAFSDCTALRSLVFEGKTLEQVKAMKNYPFGLEDESIISTK